MTFIDHLCQLQSTNNGIYQGSVGIDLPTGKDCMVESQIEQGYFTDVTELRDVIDTEQCPLFGTRILSIYLDDFHDKYVM